jgi:predicted PurR-regulated permease PerM
MMRPSDREEAMSDLHARRLLVFLVLAALALTAAIARPFWIALAWAAVIAAVLRPVMERLARALGGRRQPAAAILVVGVVALVLVPVAVLGTTLVKEIVDGIGWLRSTIQSEGILGLVDRLPRVLQQPARELIAAAPQPEEAVRALAGQGTRAAAVVGGALVATGTALFQAAMMLIALFFLLADGGRLVAWLDAQVPLRRGQLRALLEDFRLTSVTTLLATLGTAALQSALAAVGYLVAGAPNVVFLAFATFVIALVPALGATVMVVAVALLLLATGHLGGAILLGGWAIAVGLTDNVARPFLMRGGTSLHGGAVFFALLGGVAVFGPIGLLLGPLTLTFLLTTLRMYRAELPRPDPP